MLGGVLFYAVAFGGGLIAGLFRPDRAFLLMAAPCLVPLVYYARDYLHSNSAGERDSGLLLSAAGWLLLALAFVFKQIAVAQAGVDAYALHATSSPVPVCATMGVLSLLLGAVFSWLFWAGLEETAQPPGSAHY